MNRVKGTKEKVEGNLKSQYLKNVSEIRRNTSTIFS